MPRYRPTLALLTVLALNAVFWTISLAGYSGFAPPPRVVAEFLSSSALVIMSTNLLLVTRAKPFENLFVGLDRVFVSHRLNGVAAAFALCAHYLLILKTPGWTPARIVGLPTLILILTSVVIAASSRMPWRRLVPLRYQDWKLLHRFNGVLVAAGVTHSLLGHALMLSLPLMRVWIYGMAGLGLLAYVYRETLEPSRLQRHRYTVGEPRHVAVDILEIPLVAAEQPIAYRAGQFAFVRFEGGPSREQHPFTISAHPFDGHLRFSVKGSGDYTRLLQSRLSAGSAARVEGPYGRFELTRGGARQLWLAGGIGITPFLAMLPEIPDDREIHLVWTVRDASEAVYRVEIERAIAERPSAAFTLHVTGTDGHLKLADLGIEKPGELSAFVCGPKRMRDAFVGQLRGLGVARRGIFYEEFSLR